MHAGIIMAAALCWPATSHAQTAPELASGQANASPSINAALAARQHVLLPCGQYQLKTPLSIASGMSLRGVSRSCVTLLIDFESDDVVRVGDGNNIVNGAELGSLHLFALVERKDGFAVAVRRGHFIRLTDITIDGPQAGGVRFDGTGGGSFGNRLDNFEISSAAQTGIYITGYATDTFIRAGVVGSSPTSLHIDDASGLYLADLDLSPATNNANGLSQPNILVNPSRYQNVNALRATNVMADSCDGDCWRFAAADDGTTGGVTEIQITGGWGAGAVAGNGLRVANGSGVNGMVITGFDAHYNAQHGLMLDGGTNITLSAVQSFNNARASNRMEANCSDSHYSGVFLGPLTTHVTLIGVQAGSGGYMATHGKLDCQAFGLDGGVGMNDKRILTVIGGQFGGKRLPSGVGIVELGNAP